MSITVLSYDPAWADDLAQIKKELEAGLDGVPFVSIEHVGSTSIPGLAAKPILDIDVVATQEQLQPVLEALQHPDLQLIYMGELGIPDRHAFRAPQKLPVRNLYVCIEGSAALRNHLAVRELLRNDEGLRREYGALKSELAASGMEIHEYMKAKGAFMMRMLKLSNQLTDAEIEDIRTATSSAIRMAPIQLEHLFMREFVISDVDGLQQAGLATTTKEAEELVVDIIRNGGMTKRKHVELAILARGNQDESEGKQIMGRVGIRMIEDCATVATDGSLRRVLDAIPTELKRGRMYLLYAFCDPKTDDATMMRIALDAFISALAQVAPKRSSEQGATLETVWHLLEGRKLSKLDNACVEGAAVFLIEKTT
ncbi:hypothetical protein HBH98_117510 [Parastagonospora nodorum]|nr:hypothetical protein HBI10_162800 [Parastagonospora nodorum]KAH4019614.1 hypothetical protein HBI13_127160 [Parastagonospora nodorum]KAH4019626.1 hypothetical protein HBI09_183550 [Parastagonospora nodorum]KAH4181249.1 hypothetical protein HBH42_238760 [Parastagonospora nodorum]KAH4219466.1 hypothetical protein HBI06_185620 [Parastagonospora nodorum]